MAITGKPVADITRLGRPGMASGTGFLAEDEDILSVLQGDGVDHLDAMLPHRRWRRMMVLASASTDQTCVAPYP